VSCSKRRSASSLISIRSRDSIYCGSPRDALENNQAVLSGKSPLLSRCGLNFESFGEGYLRDLTEGMPAAERHFTDYFGALIHIKLRSRRLPPHAIDDIRQETFLRVFATLRGERGLDNPERLGAFVNSVCNNVYLEYLRTRQGASLSSPATAEPADSRGDAESAFAREEYKRVVEQVMSELPSKDEHLLRAVVLDEKDKQQVCDDLQVTRENLRVLLHRARTRFRDILRLRFPDLDSMGPPHKSAEPAAPELRGRSKGAL
jgi:RNA polymerase sigma-70 factor, ECF subfamily